jgi:hypothetical protein
MVLGCEVRGRYVAIPSTTTLCRRLMPAGIRVGALAREVHAEGAGCEPKRSSGNMDATAWSTLTDLDDNLEAIEGIRLIAAASSDDSAAEAASSSVCLPTWCSIEASGTGNLC